MKVILTSDIHYGMSGYLTRGNIDKMMKMIVQDAPEVLLVAGDWGSTGIKNVELGVRRIRKFYDGIIVGVPGNHDFWVTDMEANSIKTIQDVIAIQNGIFEKYMINNYALTRNEKGKSVLFLAYPGWYRNNPPSNDRFWMPKMMDRPIHNYMREWSDALYAETLKTLNNPLYDDCKKVVVTHFNITPCIYNGYDSEVSKAMSGNYDHFNELKEAGMTTLCYGHTHVFEKGLFEGVRIFNSGSDYNRPEYIMFEV